MLVYSKTLNTYLARLRQRSREILSKEMGLKVGRRRFVWGHYWIPFDIVAFEDAKKLGYFDSETFQIGLNKQLLFCAKPGVLDNILRHEWAHFYCHLHYSKSEDDSPHGANYREVCRKFGWGAEVFSAYSDLDYENQKIHAGAEFEKIFARLQKLFNLSSSPNPHEAELATLKANQLLLKYNLELLGKEEAEGEVLVRRVYWARRSDATLNVLYQVLRHFYVGTVINRTSRGVYLEVAGPRVSVELADCTGKFLALEFERLWNLAKKKNCWRGPGQKNSYIQGLGEGLARKLQKQSQRQAGESPRALVLLENQMERQMRLAYPRLGRASLSGGSAHAGARAVGASDGQNLSLKRGLSSSRPPLFLT